MTIDTPLISIITPVYNGAEYLAFLIESVLQQEVDTWEHIIIDDGSADNGATLAVLEQYAHLRWWTRENRGQYATMNEGLRAARGEWVCFISADDLVQQGAFNSVLETARRHPACQWIYGNTLFIRQDGTRHPVQSIFKRVPPRWFKYFNGIYHCSIYARRTTLLDSGLFFNEELKYSSDFDWIMRLICSGLEYGYAGGRPLAALRTHPERASIVHKQAQDAEYHSLQKRNGVHIGIQRFINFLLYLRSALLEALYMITKGQFGTFKERVRRWFRHRFERDNNGTI